MSLDTPEDKVKRLECITDVPTIAALPQHNQPALNKAITRIESAGQIHVFETEEPGPCTGQVSRGIAVCMDSIINKKPIFFVYDEENMEEKYKEGINYGDPILLRNRSEFNLKVEIAPRLFDFHKYGRTVRSHFKIKNELWVQPLLKNRILPAPKCVNSINL